MFDLFTPEARHALMFAKRRAGARKSELIEAIDLVHGSIADGVWAATMLEAAGADARLIIADLVIPRKSAEYTEHVESEEFSPAARKAIALSKRLSENLGHGVITSAHLLVATLTVDEEAVTNLASNHKLIPVDLKEILEHSFNMDS